MSNSGSAIGSHGRARPQAATFSLYTADGRRKYLNAAERERALAAMEELPRERALFALTLAWTGGRISEVLALTPLSFQLEPGIVALRTLKRRRFVMREVPIPPAMIAALDAAFDLGRAQRNPLRAHERLFCFSRTTAWRIIKQVMDQSGIAGCHAAPRPFATPSASAPCRQASPSTSRSAGLATRGSVPPRSTPMRAARRKSPSPPASGNPQPCL